MAWQLQQLHGKFGDGNAMVTKMAWWLQQHDCNGDNDGMATAAMAMTMVWQLRWHNGGNDGTATAATTTWWRQWWYSNCGDNHATATMMVRRLQQWKKRWYSGCGDAMVTIMAWQLCGKEDGDGKSVVMTQWYSNCSNDMATATMVTMRHWWWHRIAVTMTRHRRLRRLNGDGNDNAQTQLN